MAASASDLSHAFTAALGSDAVTLTLRRYAQAARPRVIQLLEPPHRTPRVMIGAPRQWARSRRQLAARTDSGVVG